MLTVDTSLSRSIFERHARTLWSIPNEAQMLLLTPTEPASAFAPVLNQTVQNLYTIQNCIKHNTLVNLNWNLTFLQKLAIAAAAPAVEQFYRVLLPGMRTERMVLPSKTLRGAVRQPAHPRTEETASLRATDLAPGAAAREAPSDALPGGMLHRLSDAFAQERAQAGVPATERQASREALLTERLFRLLSRWGQSSDVFTADVFTQANLGLGLLRIPTIYDKTRQMLAFIDRALPNARMAQGRPLTKVGNPLYSFDHFEPGVHAPAPEDTAAAPALLAQAGERAFPSAPRPAFPSEPMPALPWNPAEKTGVRAARPETHQAVLPAFPEIGRAADTRVKSPSPISAVSLGQPEAFAPKAAAHIQPADIRMKQQSDAPAVPMRTANTSAKTPSRAPITPTNRPVVPSFPEGPAPKPVGRAPMEQLAAPVVPAPASEFPLPAGTRHASLAARQDTASAALSEMVFPLAAVPTDGRIAAVEPAASSRHAVPEARMVQRTPLPAEAVTSPTAGPAPSRSVTPAARIYPQAKLPTPDGIPAALPRGVSAGILGQTPRTGAVPIFSEASTRLLAQSGPMVSPPRLFPADPDSPRVRTAHNAAQASPPPGFGPAPTVLRSSGAAEKRPVEKPGGSPEIPTVRVRRTVKGSDANTAEEQNIAINAPRALMLREESDLTRAVEAAMGKIDLKKLSDRVYRELETRLRSENARRGKW